MRCDAMLSLQGLESGACEEAVETWACQGANTWKCDQQAILYVCVAPFVTMTYTDLPVKRALWCRQQHGAILPNSTRSSRCIAALRPSPHLCPDPPQVLPTMRTLAPRICRALRFLVGP
jgi:hypothetical protein